MLASGPIKVTNGASLSNFVPMPLAYPHSGTASGGL